MRKIPRTGYLFSARLRLVPKMLGGVRKEATRAKTIHLQNSLENTLSWSTEERFNTTIISPIKQKTREKQEHHN